jgi:lipopolysaccharide transport protein LptA
VQPSSLTLILGASYIMSMVIISTCAAEDPESIYDPIVISAERASQNVGEQGFRLSGQLRINTREWTIRGDNGLVEGRIDDSDFIMVQGEPANINYNGDGNSQVNGTAEVLKYSATKNVVKLSGAAKLLKGDQSVESDEIEYFLDTGTWSAGNTSRVKMRKMIK